MGKIKIIPKLNANFFRAIYIGLLYGIFKVCLDSLALKYLRLDTWTTVSISTIVTLLAFAYVIYLVLELQDQVDRSGDGKSRKNARS
jgi:hypothetical protein